MLSRGPCYIVDRNLCISWHKWILFLLLGDQFLELREALLELLFGWWILSNGADELHGVKSCLVTLVIEQSDNFVQFVEVVNLNLSLFLLSEGSKSSGRSSPNIRDLVSEHLGERWDWIGIDGLLLSERVVTNRAQVKSSKLPNSKVAGLKVRVQPWQDFWPLDDERSSISLNQNFKKRQNENKDVFILLIIQFVNQHWDDVERDHWVDSKCEFWNWDHGVVGISSDLYDVIVEQISNFWDNFISKITIFS